MSITVQNVRGLNTKVKTFYLNALSSESDVIILAETWLREDVASEEYFGHFYDVHRCNGGYRGRGVLIAVKSTFTSRVLNLRSPVESVDIVGVKLEYNNNFINVIAIYIPPAKSSDVYEAVFEYLEQRIDLSNRTVIAGDFNIPEYNRMLNISSSQGSLNLLNTL